MTCAPTCRSVTFPAHSPKPTAASAQPSTTGSLAPIRSSIRPPICAHTTKPRKKYKISRLAVVAFSASPMLRQAAKAGRPVRVFGEMVSLLWDAGLIDAAIEVEAMWNELGAQYQFSLLCAYPAPPAVCAHQLDAVTEVCRAHT